MKKIIVILAILLSVSVFLNFKLFSKPMVEEVVESEPVANLTEAIKLLPDSEQVLAGRKLVEGIYWFWVVSVGQDGYTVDESWIVDLDIGEAKNISSRFFGPLGGTATVNINAVKYFQIDWHGGWDGNWIEAHEYFDRESGELLYTTILNNGQTAEIFGSEGQDLKISYAPENLCASSKTEYSDYGNVIFQDTDLATGLIINNETHLFPKPLELECYPIPMIGEIWHENFSYINLSENDQVIHLGLLGAKYAFFPLDNLTGEAVDFFWFE